MTVNDSENYQQLVHQMFKAHPWHGIPIGDKYPEIVNVFIEIVPTDTVKYELDKESGLLKVDRPQRYSNICPTPYGFIPQTYCGAATAELCVRKTGRPGITGDLDPLDICVLTEKNLAHGEILVAAVPIGGIRMIDGNEADDKILAVLFGDASFGAWREIGDCPQMVLDRLTHYFLTYKNAPHETPAQCEITDVYDAAEAYDVISRSHNDYRESYAELIELANQVFRSNRGD